MSLLPPFTNAIRPPQPGKSYPQQTDAAKGLPAQSISISDHFVRFGGSTSKIDAQKAHFKMLSHFTTRLNAGNNPDMIKTPSGHYLNPLKWGLKAINEERTFQKPEKSRELVLLALKKGANPNIKDDENGYKPLYSVIQLGDTEICEALLNNGANPNTVVLGGDRPLHALLDLTKNYDAHKTVREEQGYSIAKLLLEHGADPNIKTDDGWTPLIQALYIGYPKIAKLLVENGADWQSQDFKNTVAGIQEKHPEIVIDTNLLTPERTPQTEAQALKKAEKNRAKKARQKAKKAEQKQGLSPNDSLSPITGTSASTPQTESPLALSPKVTPKTDSESQHIEESMPELSSLPESTATKAPETSAPPKEEKYEVDPASIELPKSPQQSPPLKATQWQEPVEALKLDEPVQEEASEDEKPLDDRKSSQTNLSEANPFRTKSPEQGEMTGKRVHSDSSKSALIPQPLPRIEVIPPSSKSSPAPSEASETNSRHEESLSLPTFAKRTESVEELSPIAQPRPKSAKPASSGIEKVLQWLGHLPEDSNKSNAGENTQLFSAKPLSSPEPSENINADRLSIARPTETRNAFPTVGTAAQSRANSAKSMNRPEATVNQPADLKQGTEMLKQLLGIAPKPANSRQEALRPQKTEPLRLTWSEYLEKANDANFNPRPGEIELISPANNWTDEVEALIAQRAKTDRRKTGKHV